MGQAALRLSTVTTSSLAPIPQARRFAAPASDVRLDFFDALVRCTCGPEQAEHRAGTTPEEMEELLCSHQVRTWRSGRL